MSRITVGDVVTRFAESMESAHCLEDLMSVLAQITTDVLPGVETCSFTRGDGGRVYTVGSSDDVALALDEHQYSTLEGPCLQALDTGKRVEVRDYNSETQWGSFPKAALTHGVGSSISTPMPGVSTVLNAYGSGPGSLGGSDAETLEVIAFAGTLALSASLHAVDQQDVVTNLRAALASRSVIDQALGVIMAQNRCTPNEAFTILRRASQGRNTKLRDLATSIVEGISTT
jgi:hypothetical protein